MSATAEKLIQFAKSQRISKEDWIEAIDNLYAAQVDIRLDESGNNSIDHTVLLNGSKVFIHARRELLN